MGCCIAAAFVIALVVNVTRRFFGRPAITPVEFPPPATRPAPLPDGARVSPQLQLAA
jgi:hypothetical protein